MPELLWASADPDAMRAAGAFDELDNLLYHQGGWVCSAATAALPFLLDLAEGRACAYRHEVVNLIYRLAKVATTAEQRFIDPGWAPAATHAGPRMLALLADEDPAVRREAILLVVAGGLSSADVAAAMWRRSRDEQDRVTRWDLVLGFGAMLADHPDAVEIRIELTRLLDDEDVQLRFAALQALAMSDPGLPSAHVQTLIEAVLHEDASEWQHSTWIGSSPTAAIRAAGRLLQGNAPAAAAFTIRVSENTEVDQRLASLANAGLLLAEWRTVSDVLLPYLGNLLADPEPEIRYRAAHLLGCLGTAAAGHADRLAGLADDTALKDSRDQITVGDAAVWALARQRDPRCLPGLIQRLASDRLGFDTRSSHFGRNADWPFIFWQPGIHEAIVPLREHASELVGPVTARLAAATDDGLVWGLCAVIAAWRPVTEPVVPVLTALLTRDDVWPAAAAALGAIGPTAAAAGDALRRRAEQATRDSTAAWALFQVSGDAAAAKLLLRMLADEPRHTTARDLGDLGPAAASAIPRLADLATSADTWLKAEAAHAHWRISGEPKLAVAVLAEVIRPLASATACLPVQRTAMRYLADIGRPAAGAAPIAAAVLENPRRLVCFGSWRAFVEDEELREAATRLLDRTR